MEQEELGHGFKLLKSQYMRLIKAELMAFGDRSLNKNLEGLFGFIFCVEQDCLCLFAV